MVGGIFYEHGHRVIAATVGFLTLVLAVWTGRVEGRRSVRRLAWAALAIIAALASSLAVPQVRAGLLEVLQIGAVRIFLGPPTATATPIPSFSPCPRKTFVPDGVIAL